MDAPDPRVVRRSTLRKGRGAYTLCERCNNLTGALYGPAYVGWAWQGEFFRRAGPSSLALPYMIFPLRVAKQIMCMFASTCGAGFFSAHPSLKKFVLDREARGLPDSMRLYCYVLSNESSHSRTTGIVASMNIGNGGGVRTFAETSFMPFGYLLSLSGTEAPTQNLFDITFFAHHGWNDWREMHLRIPHLDSHSYLPADFRSKAEWEAALERRDSRLQSSGD